MPSIPEGPRRGGSSQPQVTSARRFLIQRTFAIYPELRDKMSVDEAVGLIARHESGEPNEQPRGTQEQAKGAATPSQIVSQSINFFVNGIKGEYGGALNRIAEARKHLDDDEKAIREQCIQDVVQYAALLARGGGNIDIEAVVVACTPLLDVMRLRAGELRELIMRSLPARGEISDVGAGSGRHSSGPRRKV